jgi:hypothetical protein
MSVLTATRCAIQPPVYYYMFLAEQKRESGLVGVLELMFPFQSSQP